MPVISWPLLDGDYTAREFVRVLMRGRDHYPVTDAMEARHPYSANVWYRSQREPNKCFLATV